MPLSEALTPRPPLRGCSGPYAAAVSVQVSVQCVNTGAPAELETGISRRYMRMRLQQVRLEARAFILMDLWTLPHQQPSS